MNITIAPGSLLYPTITALWIVMIAIPLPGKLYMLTRTANVVSGALHEFMHAFGGFIVSGRAPNVQIKDEFLPETGPVGGMAWYDDDVSLGPFARTVFASFPKVLWAVASVIAMYPMREAQPLPLALLWALLFSACVSGGRLSYSDIRNMPLIPAIAIGFFLDAYWALAPVIGIGIYVAVQLGLVHPG